MENNNNHVGYTYDEVSAITGVYKQTVANWKKNGELTTFRNPADKRTVYVESNSLIQFLAKSKNKKYLDCACNNSNLLHNNDYSIIMGIVNNRSVNSSSEDTTPVIEPSIFERPLMPTYRNTDIEAMHNHIATLRMSSEMVDDSIRALSSLKSAYLSARANIEAKRNDNNGEYCDKKINMLNSAIRGITNSIDNYKAIKRQYAASIQILELTIENDARVVASLDNKEE